MKSLLITSILCFSCAFLFGQNEKSKFEFTVIDTLSDSKENIYSRAKIWLANTFVSSKAVIELDDRDNGKIIGRGVLKYDSKYNLIYISRNIIDFIVTVDVKEGKYRVVFSEFYFKANTDGGYVDGGNLNNDKPKNTWNLSKKQWEKIKEDVRSRISFVIDDLKKSMQKPIVDDF